MFLKKLFRSGNPFVPRSVLVAVVAAFGFSTLAISPVRPLAAQDDPALVRCDPAVAAGPADLPLVVDIYVENVVDLYGADVQFSFNPAEVQVVDADPVTPGVQIQLLDTFLVPGFVVRDTADNLAGTIWYALTQLNPAPPVSGSGPLARITLQAQKAGTFKLTITNHQLAQRTGVEYPSIAQDCRLTFLPVDPGLRTYLPVAIRP